MFLIYGDCKNLSKKPVQKDPVWKNNKRKSRCCQLSRRYKTLLRKSKRTNNQCKRRVFALNSKIDGLLRALDSQQVVIREVPPNSAPFTGEELNIRKDRVVRILQETDFTKIPGTTVSPSVTTASPLTTTTTPPTTTTTTTTTPPTTTTTATTAPQTSTTQTTITSTTIPHDKYYPWSYHYHKTHPQDPIITKYDDEDEDEDEDEEEDEEEDEDESFLNELSSRERKRRMVQGKIYKALQ